MSDREVNSPVSPTIPVISHGEAVLNGPGNCRALLRAVDWSKSSLGPPTGWPTILLTALDICLGSRTSMSIWWGPDCILFYNDAYAPILGKKHPAAIGQAARDVWSDVWTVISPQLEAVARGESTLNERNLVFLDRNGVAEQGWFTWSYTPIFDAQRKVQGSFVVCVEETAHVARELELVEMRERLATTLHAAEIGFWSLDPASGLVTADANLAKAFSVSAELAEAGAPLQVFTDAIHPSDRDHTVKAINAALKSQEVFEAEYRLVPHSLGLRWVLARGRISRNSSGVATRLSGVLIDITERKQNDSLLDSQNEILQRMASEAPLSTVLEEMVRQIESRSDDIVGSVLLVDDQRRMHCAASLRLPSDFTQAMEGLEIGENVGTCGRAAALGRPAVTPDIASDPNWAPLALRASEIGLVAVWSFPIMSGEGVVLGTFGVYFRKHRGPTPAEHTLVDFLAKTAGLAIERAQSQDLLRISDERFRQIANTMPQIVWSATPDGVLDYYNERWFEYIGVAQSDMAAARWDLYLHPLDLPVAAATWRAALTSGKVYQMEFRVRDRNQNYRWFLARAVPIRDVTGKIVRWSGTCTDINDRNALHQESIRVLERERAARVMSEDAGRVKDEFLATLSHELRTPLNPVLLLATEAAQNPELSEEVRRDFESIAKNISLEARLIDDLLDLTRITRGKMSLSMAPENVHVSLRDALANVASEIEAKGIEVTTTYTEGATTVMGDAVRLQQVFWNILRNAAKFTPSGGRISIVTRPATDPRHIEILISDTGMGMQPEEIGRLFNAFTQGDHAGETGSHRFGGLGLGLAISRMLVELHSGQISATSEGPGSGSTFSVRLPVTDRVTSGPLVSTTSNAPLARPAPRSHRILLVEDHEPTRTALRHLLSRRHHTVLEAANMSDALHLAQTESFDFLMSDIGLPDGDGYELMQNLHSTYGAKGIALTGYGMQEDIERARAAGFAAHLTKPIKVQDLDAALAKIIADVTESS